MTATERKSYYERLSDAAAELFGEGSQFEFCRTIRRKHYHRIIRDGEVLAEVLLAGIPSGKRIITTFETAAESLGNVDLSKIRPTLKANNL